ncbi:MAG: aminotransferase class I/II-fold pyridoxal phosphate-dependent enzyme [Caldicoprobacterales bacterium]|jgi:8-amino-7-oxononanoate synthase|nr:aminotransferase class I/II-fold pyridoxal phosphate-dependent enzyme [Clostridiales bacterium]
MNITSRYRMKELYDYYENQMDRCPFMQVVEGSSDGTVTIRGDEKIMIGSNNYLGLTNHPEVKEAAIKAIEKYGTGCTGSRLLNGNLDLHEQLESELADFLGKEAVIVFSTGFFSNSGTISTLVDAGDIMVCDRDNHASIVQGCLLSRAAMKRYQHNDMASLERQLAAIDEEKEKFIITDGVFSMFGDICLLPEITHLAKKYNAAVIVDDAHSIGVLGENGRGTEEHYQLNNEVDVITGTFSKSFACVGGFAAASKEIVRFLKATCPSFIFTASLPPSSVATVLASLKILKNDHGRRKRLQTISSHVRDELNAMGYNTGGSQTPIIPIVIGDRDKTIAAWEFLFDNGIFCNVSISPAVPKGSDLLRTSYIATHTDTQIDYILETFRKMRKQLF